MSHKFRTGQSHGFSLSRFILLDNRPFGNAAGQRLQQFATTLDSLGRDVFRTRESGGTAFRIDEVNVTALCSKESRPAADVGITDQHVSGNVRLRSSAHVSDDRTDGRIGDAAADQPAGVNEVSSKSVLVDEVVVDGSHGRQTIGELCRAMQMFAELHAGDDSIDGVIFRPGDLR